MKKILLVEDDLSLIRGLSYALEKQGYEVDAARTIAEATQFSYCNHKDSYSLVILDVSLPDGTGFDLCKKIRETSKVPIMFLTASDEETDITMGLDIGGDDYITKPFKLAVFVSRVNALIRRGSMFISEDEPDSGNTGLHSGGIYLNKLSCEVSKEGKLIELTRGEYKLLRMFMENPGNVLSAEQLLGNLWDCDEKFIDNNSLTVYIRRLRTKIEDEPGSPKLITTIRGMGYKWNSNQPQ